MDKKVGFIGGGNMAFAIAQGLIASTLLPPQNIITSTRTRTRLDSVWKDMGTCTTTDNIEVVQTSDVVFLCVKPHLITTVLQQISSENNITNKLFISVASGVTIDTMEKILDKCRIVRTMLNTPCLVQCGVIVYSCNSQCNDNDKEIVEQMFGKIGLAEEVEENEIDSISPLIGCSPAWYYMVIEAMADGGVMNGVPRASAYRFAAKAMEGAAKMVLETGKHPGQLKDAVTSPGGVTICGVNELETSGMRGAFMRAVTSAALKKKELGKVNK